MRNKTFAELDRIASGQVRPLWAIKTLQLLKIFIVNPGCCRVLDHSVPNAGAWRCPIFKIFQPTTVGKADENDFATAGAEFLGSFCNVMKASFNRFSHHFLKLFFRNVSGRRRRSEERDPDLLNHSRQFTVWPSAFLNHARAPFAVDRSEVRWKTRRHLRIRTIGNW